MSFLNLTRRLINYSFAQIKNPLKPAIQPTQKPEITELIGQDRQFAGNLLFYDPSHYGDWFYSTPQSLERDDYLRLKRFVIKRTDQTCQCCGVKNPLLEVHERWDFNQLTLVKKLMRFVSLCYDCHNVTHMGFKHNLNSREDAAKHIMRVRNWSESEQKAHAKQASHIQSKRSQIQQKYGWSHDLSLILQNDLLLNQKSIERIMWQRQRELRNKKKLEKKIQGLKNKKKQLNEFEV